MKKTTLISIIRWTTSIIGILIIAFTLLFFIVTLLEGRNKPGSGYETFTLITFVVWGMGLAGLLFAIWKPGIGGLFSLLSFIVYNNLVAVNPYRDGSYRFVLLAFLLPAILILVFWWLKKSSNITSGKEIQ